MIQTKSPTLWSPWSIICWWIPKSLWSLFIGEGEINGQDGAELIILTKCLAATFSICSMFPLNKLGSCLLYFLSIPTDKKRGDAQINFDVIPQKTYLTAALLFVSVLPLVKYSVAALSIVPHSPPRCARQLTYQFSSRFYWGSALWQLNPFSPRYPPRCIQQLPSAFLLLNDHRDCCDVKQKERETTRWVLLMVLHT